MNGVLLQVFEDGSSSYEVNKIFQASLTYDIPRLKCQLPDLKLHQGLLHSYLPVGTVEFMQEAMRLLGCELPPWNCYPDVLRPFLHREVSRTTKGTLDLSADVFVKPAEHLKAFTGDGADDAPEPDGRLVGEMATDLSDEFRYQADDALSQPFALDVGVLATGQTALVEVNDAWAIGLYENALSPSEYYRFLISRWDSIRSRA